MSSAQNVGYGFVVLPYAFFGWRLQIKGIELGNKILEVTPVHGYEPTREKLEVLRKTPYQDPQIKADFETKATKLNDYSLQLQQVQLGVLMKAPERTFCSEWAKQTDDEIVLLTFEPLIRSFRVQWDGHRSRIKKSILVHITSVKKLYIGYDFGNPFVVALLEVSPALKSSYPLSDSPDKWTPSYESEIAGARAMDGPKREREDIRNRLNALDDTHVVCFAVALP